MLDEFHAVSAKNRHDPCQVITINNIDYSDNLLEEITGIFRNYVYEKVSFLLNHYKLFERFVSKRKKQGTFYFN